MSSFTEYMIGQIENKTKKVKAFSFVERLCVSMIVGYIAWNHGNI